MARKSALDRKGLGSVRARIGDAVIDPALWPEIMEQISRAVAASGAVLLQSDVRGSDVPRTAGVAEMISNYFANGWHTRDIRADRGIPLLLAGQKVVTDQDILTPEEMTRSDYYAEAVLPFGFQWFAAVGFSAQSALWALVIQRTRKEEAFDRDVIHALGSLVPDLNQAATLSKAVGKATLSSITNALDLVKQPAIALDRLGFVLQTNEAAVHIFDDEFCVRYRRLRLKDRQAQAALDSFIDQLRTITDRDALIGSPIFVRRQSKWPLIIHTLPVEGAARSPFLGARALLIISDPNLNRVPRLDLLARTFGLSPSEARLAPLIAAGLSPEQAASKLGLAYETARSHLKSIFAKTGTRRQSELVALLSRF